MVVRKRFTDIWKPLYVKSLYPSYKAGGGAHGAPPSPPPPRAEKVCREKAFSAEKRELVKNAKDEPFSSDLSLYPMFFSAVDHLELC